MLIGKCLSDRRIHMNGRVYDPEIGRFLSADPHVQSPYSSQSYNRYSYALNNPLKYTDPSGFFFKKLFKSIGKFFKKYGRLILAVAVGALTGYMALLAYTGTGWGALSFSALVAKGGIAGAAIAGGAGGFASGLVSTGSFKGALRGAAFGAIAGAAAFGVGHMMDFSAFGELAAVAKDITHGLAQGVISEIGGGDFKSGFFGATLGHFAGRHASSLFKGTWLGTSVAGKTIVASVVGGTAAVAGGGKFANGAISAAFTHLFNNSVDSLAVSNNDLNEMGVDAIQYPTQKSLTHVLKRHTLAYPAGSKAEGQFYDWFIDAKMDRQTYATRILLTLDDTTGAFHSARWDSHPQRAGFIEAFARFPSPVGYRFSNMTPTSVVRIGLQPVAGQAGVYRVATMHPYVKGD